MDRTRPSSQFFLAVYQPVEEAAFADGEINDLPVVAESFALLARFLTI